MDIDKVKARATNNAYALLRQRPRSEFEIRERLKLKGYVAEVVDGVVEALRRAGEIDDARFAKLWVESRMHTNPQGDVVLKHELKLKGVSEPIIEATLQDKAKNYDEYEIALSMAGDRFLHSRPVVSSYFPAAQFAVALSSAVSKRLHASSRA